MTPGARWSHQQPLPLRAASTPVSLTPANNFRGNLSFEHSRKRQPSVENLRALIDG